MAEEVRLPTDELGSLSIGSPVEELLQLPDELLAVILSFCDATALACLDRATRRFRSSPEPTILSRGVAAAATRAHPPTAFELLPKDDAVPSSRLHWLERTKQASCQWVTNTVCQRRHDACLLSPDPFSGAIDEPSALLDMGATEEHPINFVLAVTEHALSHPSPANLLQVQRSSVELVYAIYSHMTTLTGRHALSSPALMRPLFSLRTSWLVRCETWDWSPDDRRVLIDILERDGCAMIGLDSPVSNVLTLMQHLACVQRQFWTFSVFESDIAEPDEGLRAVDALLRSVELARRPPEEFFETKGLLPMDAFPVDRWWIEWFRVIYTRAMVLRQNALMALQSQEQQQEPSQAETLQALAVFDEKIGEAAALLSLLRRIDMRSMHLFYGHAMILLADVLAWRGQMHSAVALLRSVIQGCEAICEARDGQLLIIPENVDLIKALVGQTWRTSQAILAVSPRAYWFEQSSISLEPGYLSLEFPRTSRSSIRPAPSKWILNGGACEWASVDALNEDTQVAVFDAIAVWAGARGLASLRASSQRLCCVVTARLPIIHVEESLRELLSVVIALESSGTEVEWDREVSCICDALATLLSAEQQSEWAEAIEMYLEALARDVIDLRRVLRTLTDRGGSHDGLLVSGRLEGELEITAVYERSCEVCDLLVRENRLSEAATVEKEFASMFLAWLNITLSPEQKMLPRDILRRAGGDVIVEMFHSDGFCRRMETFHLLVEQQRERLQGLRRQAERRRELWECEELLGETGLLAYLLLFARELEPEKHVEGERLLKELLAWCMKAYGAAGKRTEDVFRELMRELRADDSAKEVLLRERLGALRGTAQIRDGAVVPPDVLPNEPHRAAVVSCVVLLQHVLECQGKRNERIALLQNHLVYAWLCFALSRDTAMQQAEGGYMDVLADDNPVLMACLWLRGTQHVVHLLAGALMDGGPGEDLAQRMTILRQVETLLRETRETQDAFFEEFPAAHSSSGGPAFPLSQLRNIEVEVDLGECLLRIASIGIADVDQPWEAGARGEGLGILHQLILPLQSDDIEERAKARGVDALQRACCLFMRHTVASCDDWASAERALRHVAEPILEQQEPNTEWEWEAAELLEILYETQCMSEKLSDIRRLLRLAEGIADNGADAGEGVLADGEAEQLCEQLLGVMSERERVALLNGVPLSAVSLGQSEQPEREP